MARTLYQLKQSIERLIEKQGEDAPVAAFIYTKDDAVDFDDNGNEIPLNSEDDVDEVLSNLEENDWVYEQIFDCIADEIKELKNKNKKEN